MLPRNDVLYVKLVETVVLLTQAAILAAISGSLPELSLELVPADDADPRR